MLEKMNEDNQKKLQKTKQEFEQIKEHLIEENNRKLMKQKHDSE